MPEILTKYPDIVIEILQKQGIKCAKGADQKILKECPAESFCSLDAGELCVYGLDQFEHMTQIKKEDLFSAEKIHPTFASSIIWFLAGFMFAFLLMGTKKPLIKIFSKK